MNYIFRYPITYKQFINFLNICYKKNVLSTNIIENSKDVSSIYGETLPSGMEKLIKLTQITENDIFADLGSGTGKIVWQIYMRTPVKMCIGIEACNAKYEKSMNIRDIIVSKFPNLFNLKEIYFENKNIYDFDFSIPTVIFMNSVCFNENLIDFISKKCTENKNIRMIISNKSLFLNSFKLYFTIDIENSWCDKIKTFIYVKSQ